MKRRFRKLLTFPLACATLLVAGCSLAAIKNTATFDTLAVDAPRSADYGPMPEAYEDAVKEAVSATLPSPTVAEYRVGMPQRGAAKIDGTVQYGWLVDAMVNNAPRVLFFRRGSATAVDVTRASKYGNVAYVNQFSREG